jgi:uncharacterized damage-inducible protein DinB
LRQNFHLVNLLNLNFEIRAPNNREQLWKTPLAGGASLCQIESLAKLFASQLMPKNPSLKAGPLGIKYLDRLPEALLNAFQTNDRINHYLIENLPPAAWKEKPPDGKGRTVAAIVAHMHNVRVMWLKVAKAEDIPAQLDRATVTPPQALRALEASRLALDAVMSRALETDGRVRGFRPDVAGFFGYLIAHDAHHRGQITMLARQVGHPLPQKAMFGMWEWGSRG